MQEFETKKKQEIELAHQAPPHIPSTTIDEEGYGAQLPISKQTVQANETSHHEPIKEIVVKQPKIPIEHLHPYEEIDENVQVVAEVKEAPTKKPEKKTVFNLYQGSFGENNEALVSDIYETLPAVQPNSLLDGEYNEEESASSFKEALMAWREGNSQSSISNPETRTQSAVCETQTTESVKTQALPSFKPDFEKGLKYVAKITYFDKLEKHLIKAPKKHVAS